LPHLHLFPELTEPNTCLISENFATLYKVKAGDMIELHGPNGLVPLRVLGAVQEYSWSRGAILVDRNFYAQAFNDPMIDTVHVFLHQDEHESEAWNRVKAFTDSQALIIVTKDDFNKMVTRFIRRIYALAYMQQIAVGAVAALGVVTALLISVLQRRRELGLLRAVGATQGQVLNTVLAEATLMGIIGTLLGVLAGVPLEWYLLRVVIYEESGFMFPVTFPWQETAILSAAAIGTATLAGLVPALHAVRLRIVEAIAYE
jgi:putative ABC transport system permease protein